MKWNTREYTGKKRFCDLEVGDTVYRWNGDDLHHGISEGVVNLHSPNQIDTDTPFTWWRFDIFGTKDDFDKSCTFAYINNVYKIFATSKEEILNHKHYSGFK